VARVFHKRRRIPSKGRRAGPVVSDFLTFQPWFLPEKVAYAIRALNHGKLAQHALFALRS
jgi:hypothetical protein